ncbi:hypothetical protein N9L68_05125 [bacterium]|nr:hypothetical protein [bacterium]
MTESFACIVADFRAYVAGVVAPSLTADSSEEVRGLVESMADDQVDPTVNSTLPNTSC